MTTGKILNLARAVFLGLSAACLATAYVWHRQPKIVQRVDDWFVLRNLWDAELHLKQARDFVADDRPDDAIRTLEGLVPDLRHAGRIHRLERARIGALALLSDLLAKRGEFDRALEYADELHDHDDRDLINEVRRTKLLGQLGRHGESFAVIKSAARVGLGNPLIADAYLVGLARSESADAALRAILRHGDKLLPAVPSAGWESMITPVSGAMIRVRDSIAIDGSSRMRWVVPVAPEPVALKRIRLDLPASTPIRLEHITVVLRTIGDRELVLDLENLLHSPRMERAGEGLVYRGGVDPYLVLDIPESMQTETVREVEYRANVYAVLGEELSALLIRADALGDMDALAAEFGADRLARIEEAMR